MNVLCSMSAPPRQLLKGMWYVGKITEQVRYSSSVTEQQVGTTSKALER
jgi:hypothetical protein